MFIIFTFKQLKALFIYFKLNYDDQSFVFVLNIVIKVNTNCQAPKPYMGGHSSM